MLVVGKWGRGSVERRAGSLPKFAGIVACGAFAGAALGQAQPTVAVESIAEPATIEEVVVTARRRSENAQDVPIPITAVSGDVLERSGQYRLEDLNQRLPSLNAQFANPRQTSIAVRGLGNNPANDGLESSVGVYLDDVYLGRPGMANQDLIDIDQVELLRGPQGTLFGKNTTAGVLNFSSRAPSFTPDARIEASFGDYDYYQLRGTLNGPLFSDELAGRLSYAKTSRDGYVKDVFDGRRLNAVNRDGLRGQLLYKPSENFDARIIGDYNEENSACCVSVLNSLGPNGGAALQARLEAANAQQIYDPNYRTSTLNDRQYMSVRQGGGSAQLNWRKNGFQMTSISAYRSWWFLPTNDGDGNNASALINAGQKVDDEQWTQEFRIASSSGKAVDWVAGAYYFYQYQKNRSFFQYGPSAQAFYGLKPFFNDAFSQLRSYPRTNSYSLFGQATWHATDALAVTLGLRDTEEHKKSHLYRDAPTGPAGIELALPAYDSHDLKLSNNTVSALASAAYEFTPQLLSYVSVARGAKAGGINALVPAAGLTADSLYISPEKATDYEIGVKSTFLQERVLANANLFWSDVTDYQATQLIQTTPGVFVQTIGNIGKVRTRGIETELSTRPSEWLSFNINASYNDAVYRSYQNAPCSVESVFSDPPTCTPSGNSLSGQQVVGAPRWVVSPTASAQHALTSDLDGYGVVGYSWRSSFFGTSDNSPSGRVDAYGLMNLRAGVRGSWGTRSRWDASVWANNLTNKKYLVGGLSGPTFNAYSLFPGTPRYIGATLRVDF